MSFVRNRPFTARLLATIAVVLLSLPVLLPGAIGSMADMSTSPTDWIPRTFAERQQYDAFVARFERESAIVISWPGCTLDDLRLTCLTDKLAAMTQPAPDADDPVLLERVVTGQSVLGELTSPPLEMSREEAISRLRGFLIGRDRRTTCAVVILTEEGNRQRNRSVEAVIEAAAECGVDPHEQRLSGGPVEARIIDEESGRTLSQFGIPSGLVSLVLCWFCLRSWRYTLAIVIAAGLGEAITLALVYYSGVKMNALLIVMPPLIFVLTVSAGVHLTNYYFEEARSGDLRGAVHRAVAIGWLPCLLATATTAIGIGSLAVSDVLPVKYFGIFSPLGLIATVIVLFMLLPGVLESWPKRPRSVVRESSTTARREVGRDAIWWDRLWRLVTRNAMWIVIGCLALMLYAGWGLSQLQSSVDVRALFTRKSRFLRDYNWLDEHVAPLVPIEVVVRIPESNKLDLLQRFEMIRAAADAAKSLESVEGVMAADTYAGKFPEPRGLFKVVGRRMMLNHMKRDLQRFTEARYLSIEDGQQYWRISVRLRLGEEAEYDKHLAQLRDKVEPVLDEYRAEDAAEADGIETTYTGAMPLTDRVHHLLLGDLYFSFFTATVLVAVVMMLVLRSVGAGLLAMLPNVFPMVLLFGLMGHLGIRFDIGSMMTASVALGIAVDDTLHFLTWYRRETQAGSAPVEAVRRCYRHCGRAMVQTTLICGLGLSVFVFSGFLPTQRFCTMIMILLLTALIGDLVFLPALLVGPLGRFFTRRLRGRGEQALSKQAA
ncbi:MAG: MMPL family transporter [Pirellulaceae bacterium]